MIRRHRRPVQDSDLDITAFMNLMIVLVPILLMNLIFAQTSIIELNFPRSESETPIDPEQFDLSVAIYQDSIDVLEGSSALIKRIDNAEDGVDQDKLSAVMQELKKRVPEERSVSILAEAGTSYQKIVAVMGSSSFGRLRVVLINGCPNSSTNARVILVAGRRMPS
ncbi:hypothetical protein A3758_16920 [Oleiphilus sp. HI0118]|nr:hypothetical protein A3758_16920 [Oleiphilus sp. HI0118]